MENKKQLMGKKQVIALGAGILAAVLLIAFLAAWLWGRDLTLEKIAYNGFNRKSCVVYIRENSEYVPYLVLTADYDGKVLLLRENLLSETMQYHEADVPAEPGSMLRGEWRGTYGSYYEESLIDAYLNTDFPDRFSPAVREAIRDTTIEVTDKASWEKEHRASATHRIERKVFLLSASELGMSVFLKSGIGYDTTKEGEPLRYFPQKDRRNLIKTAYMADGSIWTYWTRTPEVRETYMVNTVNYHLFDTAPADSYMGVRPAFCMDRDTAVQKRENIVEGKSVYILEIDADD